MTTMYKFSIFLFTISFLFLSCNKNKKDLYGEEIFINIDSKSLNFCDIIDNIDLIKLETTDSSLISYIDRIKIIEDKIYISDNINHSLYVFHYPTGRFLNSIMAYGNGPTNYLDISDFNVNLETDEIEILDSYAKKLIKYNQSGTYINNRMIHFYAESFSYLNDRQNIVFSKYSIENAEPNVEIIITDDKLNITNKYCEVKNFTSYQIQSGNQVNILSDHTISFLPKNSSDIYYIADSTIQKKYELNFGRNWDPDIFYLQVDNPKQIVDVSNQRNLVVGLGKQESQEEILISFWLKNKYHLVIYNKEKKKAQMINPQTINNERIFLKGIHNDFFIMTKSHIAEDEGLKENCLIQEDEDSIIDSNPSLMLVKFKH